MRKKCRLGLTNAFINSMTPEDAKRIASFFSEIGKIESVVVDENNLEFSYDISQEKKIIAIADKYLLNV